eukprot:scaffold76129_cov60-Phaeocystis_antarctica.AAC.1
MNQLSPLGSKQHASRMRVAVSFFPAHEIATMAYPMDPSGQWVLGERPDHRFEFLERYGPCRVVMVSKVPGSAEVACGVPRLRGTVSGCLSHSK